MKDNKTFLLAIALIIGVVFLLFAIVAAFIVLNYNISFTPRNSGSIDSFTECVEAGYPILESYPEQCMTPDGRTFVNPSQVSDGGTSPSDGGGGGIDVPPSTGAPQEPTKTPGSGTGSGSICKDMCGDSMCQAVVCLGEGCPCAETPTSCPADCG